MKILFVSMPSVHAIRWIENLKDTSFEMYWYDVTNRGRIELLESVQQFAGVNTRKHKPFKGEYTLSKKLPKVYAAIRPFLEVTENEVLEKIILEIRPDVVHSFEMQTCSYPILKTMQKFPEIKWIYSCWGSDLYYFKNLKEHRAKIEKVLTRVDYIHTDCERDFKIAKELGFKGKHTGIIPGGSGYDLAEIVKYKKPVNERNIILVKGYQHYFGRALNVVKALEQIKSQLGDYRVIVFGTHQPVIDYIKEQQLAFTAFGRNDLKHLQVMDLMSEALLYIGNSTSDGMPNTLLEAMASGAFPIQSNPGNVTAEIIQDGVNGFLINDPENVGQISTIIEQALTDVNLRSQAVNYNHKFAVENLDYQKIRKKIINLYPLVVGSHQ